MEFILPLGANPRASEIRMDVAGLDPESWIEVAVNGESFGAMGAFSLALNSPSSLFSDSGRLLFAGWRPASLFLPARLWKEGDNSIVLTLHHVLGDGGNPVFLRRAQLDLLFPPSGTPVPLTATDSATAAPSPTPSLQSSTALSNGSLYGNPSPSLFHSTTSISLPASRPAP